VGIAISITWLGHATVVLELGGARMVTDPLLRAHAGPLWRRQPAPPSRLWHAVDAVLLSHLHHDHADLPSLRMLGQVPILTSPRNAAWLRRRGLQGVPLDDWAAVGEAGEVAVRSVPAVHHSRRMPHRPNDVQGHLVRSAAGAVWLAGDTSLYDGMRDLPSWAGVDRLDLAVVPIGGWGPRLSPGHMGPEEAAEACARTGARVAVPVHWGTFHVPPTGLFGDWMDRPADAFAEALQRTAPGCRLARLRPGENVLVVPDVGPERR
jgi:L-ascorbate metabolism protein UlaG (beta-lactamase superfamily)